MTALADKTCVPCRGGVPALTAEQIVPLRAQVPDWEVVESHHLKRLFKFKDFREALDFTNAVGELAEQQGHHPTSTSPGARWALRYEPTRSTA